MGSRSFSMHKTKVQRRSARKCASFVQIFNVERRQRRHVEAGNTRCLHARHEQPLERQCRVKMCAREIMPVVCVAAVAVELIIQFLTTVQRNRATCNWTKLPIYNLQSCPTQQIHSLTRANQPARTRGSNLNIMNLTCALYWFVCASQLADREWDRKKNMQKYTNVLCTPGVKPKVIKCASWFNWFYRCLVSERRKKEGGGNK